MCYTSGTTGQAEGRRLLAPLDRAAHARRRAGDPLGLGIGERRRVLPVVPMFHANAWGYPVHLRRCVGAKLVFPGPHLDPESLLDDFVQRAGHAGRPACRRSGSGSSQLLDANPGALGPLGA